MAPKPQTNALPALAPNTPDPDPSFKRQTLVLLTKRINLASLRRNPAIASQTLAILTEAEKLNLSTSALIISAEVERSLYNVAICNICNLISKYDKLQ